MKFRISGEFRRPDLEPVLILLPALRGEWERLTFGPDGRLTNPLSGETVEGLAQVSGCHRQVGALYRVTLRKPRFELPEGRKAEFDEEAAELGRSRVGTDSWAEHTRRRRAAMVQAGTDTVHYDVTLRHDDSRRMALRVADGQGQWELDLEIEHTRLPRVELTGRVDLTAVLKAGGSPGCLARLLGGRGEAHAVIDAGSFERSGEVARAEGRVNRFRGDGRLAVRSSTTRWSVSGVATLRARGLGRLVLLFAGRRIRREVDDALTGFWSGADRWASELQREIAEIENRTEAAGGPSPYVHQALWDGDFRRMHTRS